VVLQAVPKIPEPIVDKMIVVAGEIRRLFAGADAEGGPELTVTMSTRTLVRWASLSLAFKGAPRVFEYALGQALTARAEPEQREAIHRIAADVFGDYWEPRP
jgi:cobaltochelatase CobS